MSSSRNVSEDFEHTFTVSQLVSYCLVCGNLAAVPVKRHLKDLGSFIEVNRERSMGVEVVVASFMLMLILIFISIPTISTIVCSSWSV